MRVGGSNGGSMRRSSTATQHSGGLGQLPAVAVATTPPPTAEWRSLTLPISSKSRASGRVGVSFADADAAPGQPDGYLDITLDLRNPGSILGDTGIAATPNCSPTHAGSRQLLDGGSHGHSHDAPRDRRPVQKRSRRLFTVEHRGLVFDEGAAAASSWPTTPAWSPNEANTSLSGGGSMASASRTLSQASGGLRQRVKDTVTPGWSLRYCEFIGSSIEKVKKHHRNFLADGAAGGRGEKSFHRRSTLMISSPPLREDPKESVFFASAGLDRRKGCAYTGRDRESRLVARRNAILPVGQSRMQARVAVKMMCQTHPKHMRKLLRSCESGRQKSKLVHVQSKELADNDITILAERIGMPEIEIESLYDIFDQYDVDGNGVLDRAEVRLVLADLGLRPRSQDEKEQLNELLDKVDKTGRLGCDFEEFLTVVRTLRDRPRLRSNTTMESLDMVAAACTQNGRELDLNEVITVLDSIGIFISTEDERLEVTTLFGLCDSDADGVLDTQEFHVFVHRVRARLLMMRNEHEMTIAKAFRLDATLLAEFRLDLRTHWEVFNRYDSEGLTKLDQQDLWTFLLDTGVLPVSVDMQTVGITDVLMECCVWGALDFTKVLRVVREIRARCKELLEDELWEKFQSYDRNHNGTLEMPEIYRLLEELRMLPRSRQEQLELAGVIERLNTNSTGKYDFAEFQDFFQRLSEQLRYTDREKEWEAVRAFGFTDRQLADLRRVFMRFGPDAHGKAESHLVASSIPTLRGVLGTAHVDEERVYAVMRRTQRSPDKTVDFLEFVRAAKAVEGAEGADAAEKGKDTTAPPRPSKQLGAAKDADVAGEGAGQALIRRAPSAPIA